MNTDTQVLIVGAGPTGLAAAAILGKLGIRVRVIDKNSARSDKSKALGVQAGTLECLAKVFGPSLSQSMISAGRPTQEAFIHIDQKSPIKVDLSSIPSQFNYILILAQSETERFLEEEAQKYSVHVERQTELLSIEEKDQKIRSTVKLASGEIETILSDFAIGCDGAHSVVRHALHINFEGDPYTGDFILGDVQLKWPWPDTAVRTFISAKGIIASFPMTGDHHYRLILIPKLDGAPPNTSEISPDEFQKIVSHLSDRQIEVLKPIWLTRFRVHHRLAHHFQVGRMFLAGDAAHIHSPAGGQGMNTGIQDALNLGVKLASVLNGKLNIDELENYEKERMPVARGVVHGTDTFFKLALLSETKTFALIRKYLLPKIVGNSWIQHRVTKAMSQMKIAQKEISRYPAFKGKK